MTAPPRVRGSSDYLELRNRVLAAGLLDRQPAYYLRVSAVAFGLTAAALFAVLSAGGLVELCLATVLLALGSGRLGLLVHDLGHRQVFGTRRASTVSGLIVGNLLSGFSWSWWVADHNRHHRHTNQTGRDPSLVRTFTAFTPADALATRGFTRFMVRRQAVFEIPLYAFVVVLFLAESIAVLVRGKARHTAIEALLMIAHYLLLLGVLLTRLPLGPALAVIVVQKALFGLYAGSVVAPNHKGMPLLAPETGLDFARRQILPSRNVVGSRLVDVWYGGLNSQIEHHLFPNMPRNKLPAARVIVRRFCVERGIPYHETSVAQAYREILGFLSRASAPLRASA